MTSDDGEGLDCADFVEMITDYLEGAIPMAERARIEAHLRECEGCAKALDQWRVVVELSGQLSEQEVEGLDAATRAGLLEAFRNRET